MAQNGSHLQANYRDRQGGSASAYSRGIRVATTCAVWFPQGLCGGHNIGSVVTTRVVWWPQHWLCGDHKGYVVTTMPMWCPQHCLCGHHNTHVRRPTIAKCSHCIGIDSRLIWINFSCENSLWAFSTTSVDRPTLTTLSAIPHGLYGINLDKQTERSELSNLDVEWTPLGLNWFIKAPKSVWRIVNSCKVTLVCTRYNRDTCRGKEKALSNPFQHSPL